MCIFRPVKRALFIFLLLVTTICRSQTADSLLLLITKNKLYSEKERGSERHKHWRFKAEDSAAMSAPTYNDAGWAIVNPELNEELPEYKKYKSFDKIGWFRLKFRIDTSLLNIPLALKMQHYGASEVYLDGKKMGGYGIVAVGEMADYRNPSGEPFVVTLPDTQIHTLAIRYAAFPKKRVRENLQNTQNGISVSFTLGNPYISGYVDQLVIISLITLAMFGIFLALSLLHLFLYLYYRLSKSSIYFCLFSFSLSLSFLFLFLISYFKDPDTILTCTHYSMYVVAAICFSLSGFINELFSKNKIRFYIISAICVCSIVSLEFSENASSYLPIVMVVGVATEALTLTTIAIIRKTRGAWIIGGGILLFASFVLIIFVQSMTDSGISLNSDSVVGVVLLILGALGILCIPISMAVFLAWNFASVSKDLQRQLVQVKLLSERALEHEQEKKKLLEEQNETLEREVAKRTAEVVAQKEKIEKQHTELKLEKKKSDDLLLNILPDEVAEELKNKGYSDARNFNNVSVLFTDFVDFTVAGEKMNAQELVGELHTCFKAFDEIITKYNIEKIKTIGDAYMAVCGLPVEQPHHAEKTAMAALEILAFIEDRQKRMPEQTFRIRIGLHTGSVVAGIVGVKKFAYDIWGDTVNTAARMEQSSEPGRINCSENIYELIKDRFDCTPRGKIKVKSKGEMNMYFINQPKP